MAQPRGPARRIGRRRRRHRHHRGRVPARAEPAPADVPGARRQQPPARNAEAARFRQPGADTAHRSQGGRSRGEAPRVAGHRHRGDRVHPAHPRLPRQRPVHRLGSLPRRAARAAAAAAGGRLREEHPRRSAVAEAPGGGHELGHGVRAGSGRRVPPPQREGEARRGRLHGRPVPHRAHGHRRRGAGALHEGSVALQVRRAPQGPLPDRRHAGAARLDDAVAAAGRGLLPDQPAAVRQPGAGARAAHPAQDGRQGRGRGAQAGRVDPQGGEGGWRRLPRPGPQVLRGRGEQRQRRRPGLLRPWGDGQGVRGRRVRDGARPDVGSRPDRLRLPHHQGAGEARRRPARRSPR